MERTSLPVCVLGFIVNPIAGMGGRVGLKGTDGVVAEARKLGAKPVAAGRARRMLTALAKRLDEGSAQPTPHWLTGAGPLGAQALAEAGFDDVQIVHEGGATTSRADTEKAVRRFVAEGAQLVVFCGGDGTALDVSRVCGDETPIVGIPSGVKMYSGVFGVSPDGVASLIARFMQGKMDVGTADILDLDEERYRHGDWAVRLRAAARTLIEPTLIQRAKMLIVEQGEDEVKDDIAAYVLEMMDAAPRAVHLLGPGSTVQSVGKALGVEKTLLGIDAVAGGQLVGHDLNERDILDLLSRYPEHRLIVSPIGAQGFVLGRGNLQLSPAVIRVIGVDNLLVLATPAKLARTPGLRVDSGDECLDRTLVAHGYLSVITGYRRRRMAKVCS